MVVHLELSGIDGIAKDFIVIGHLEREAQRTGDGRLTVALLF